MMVVPVGWVPWLRARLSTILSVLAAWVEDTAQSALAILGKPTETGYLDRKLLVRWTTAVGVLLGLEPRGPPKFRAQAILEECSARCHPDVRSGALAERAESGAHLMMGS